MNVPRDQILGAVDNYGTSRVRAAQLQQLARQGRMDDLKYQQAQQGVADDQAIRQAFSSSIGQDGSVNRAKLLQSLASGGQGQAAQKLSGEWAEQDAKLEEAKAQAASAVSKMTVAQREEAQKRTTAVGKASKWVLTLPAEQQQQGFDLAAETLGMPNLKGRPVNQKELQLWAASADIFQEALDPYKAQMLDMKGRELDETSRHNRAMESKPSGGGTGLTKAPSGYRYTGEGDLEPIPGGPADAKRSAEEAKVGQAMDSMDTTIDTATRLLNHPGLAGSVGTWNATRFIPGTEAANFQAELDTFKAQTFVPMVQKLRGLGQLSDAEGKKLTDAVGALQNSMSEKAFKESLNRIISDLNKVKGRTANSMVPRQEEAPSAPRAAPSAPASVLAGAPPAIVNAYYAGKKIQGPDGKTYQKGR